ncbi:MAG: DUF1631 family protein [Pseudomonadota bacterium]
MDVEPHAPGQPSPQGGGHGRPSDHWSGRARRLIERCQAMSADWLKQPVRACLDELERQLFALSEGARDPFDQQRHFNVRQRVMRERGALEARFLDRVGDAFRQLGQSAAPSADEDPQHLQLSLVDTSEHEMTVALDKLAARGEARGSAALYELGYRLAVLVAAPPLEGGDVPVGPLTLARSLRSAAGAIELPVEHDLLLLRCLETALLPELPGFYGALNTMLEQEGILPLLRPYPLVRPAAPATARAGGAPAASGTPAGVAPAAAAAVLPGTAGVAADHVAASEPIAVLDSLRELLARRRRSPAVYGGEPVEAATPEELQTALSALQKHLSQVADKATRELRSAQLLREELLVQLNADKPSGAPRTGLSAEQGDTVELVSMLFEQLSQQTQHNEGTHALLGGLQLPVLRMAVSDRNFFEQKEHPARQLLGTVTEVANDWLDDSGSDADRHLRTKLEQLVERANREPPSAGLYTALLADIQQHLTLLTRKAQATERRHIEAMQGRERLDQARQRAAKLIGDRFAQDPPRGLLRALLDRAWSDVLALTILRHGEESDAVAAQLLITDQLLGRKPVADRRQLQADVEAGLQQIGMHHEEAIQVAQRLVNPGDAPAPMTSGETLSTTDLAMRLKQHQRLGEHQQPAAAAPASAPAQAPAKAARERREPPARPPARREPVVDPREIETQERLRLLPFGRWFEFTDRKTGKVSQRKLAWFSPVSGQTLFVNRRGIRAEDISLPQLAHEIVKGRVRELGEMKESLLDRAWHSLTGNLLRTPNGRHGRHGH